MCQTKCVEGIKAQVLCSAIFFEDLAVYELKWNNFVGGASNRWQYCAFTLHAG